MTIDELIPLVIQWGEDKNIVHNNAGQALIQLEKTKEEVRELANAIISSDDLTATDIQLEYGDVLVTLIMNGACLGIDPASCLEQAYNKISKRTGTVVNGLFVKDK